VRPVASPSVPPQFQALPGTFDVLPPESARYERLIALFASLVERAGYGLVLSPVMEDHGLFSRVGTEMVRKEMYEFRDRGDRHIALRPEGTAPVMRAYLQHKPPTPFKAWYAAPNFRQERPQALRYRQHHQVGLEAIGSDDPDLDVEVITLQAGFYAALGLTQVTLLINSLGDGQCRPVYHQALLGYLRQRADRLCDEHKERYDENPLRVLDCKKDACRTTTADAPRQLDALCDECRTHFERVQDGLRAAGVEFEIAPRLVRGLDYYTRTTFEFAAQSLDAAQNAIGGGGRYDGLAETLGGPHTPGIGFGSGIERILAACDAEGVFAVEPATLDAFVVDTVGGAAARDLCRTLRAAGLRVDRAFDNRSMKSQFKAADRSGARFALVVGDEEASSGKVAVRDLRSGGEQELVDQAELAPYLQERLNR
jgi:histidyl-tRNA synthetase